MKEGSKNALKTVGAAAAGGAAGAGVYWVIGGVGVAATGTAVGITLGPFIAIGAGLGAVGYGVYWLGKQAGGAGQKKLPDKQHANELEDDE